MVYLNLPVQFIRFGEWFRLWTGKLSTICEFGRHQWNIRIVGMLLFVLISFISPITHVAFKSYKKETDPTLTFYKTCLNFNPTKVAPTDFCVIPVTLNLSSNWELSTQIVTGQSITYHPARPCIRS